MASCASPGCPVLRVLWPRRVTDSTSYPASSVLWLCRRWIFELPRISHRSALLVSVTHRVAPFSSLPLAALSIQASGFPSSCISGFAGDGVPSRLEPRILRRCRLTVLQVALNSGPSVSPSTRPASCPAFRIVRLRLVVSQVALGLAPSGCASGESSSLPEPLSPGIPSGEAPSCPGSSILWFRRWSRLSGCPESQVLRRCDDWISGSPRITVPRLSVYASPGCPGSTIYGWVDDESLAVLELCILSSRRG